GKPMIASQLKSLRPFLRSGDFSPGSRGQANVDTIAPFVDVNVRKVAYSPLFNPQLDSVPRHAGIDTAVVCGIVTNGGVASTVRDAHMREYHALVLEDGCAAFSDALHAASIADLRTVADITSCDGFRASMAEATTGRLS